ncbi:hypothetical protein O6H91_18G049400 [Diphasiastrum complanatum]|uniref:Uncharacterized protein n=2 Tax=Diphasiastrum complanatum TaxID=34168 RepID=A0ACC2B0U8_DIPCM|nr:hypothetical protein O6H91_18G049400 [Diphasiastrum complanatum]
MISLAWSSPSSKQQASCLSRTRSGQYNYDGKYVGATMEAIHADLEDTMLKRDGYFINHARVKLGCGLDVYNKGKDLLKQWRHFQLGWAFVDQNTPMQVGEKLCVCNRELFIWIMNPLEILFLREDGNISKTTNLKITRKNTSSLKRSNLEDFASSRLFAFGSGTLHGHLLAGEERFAVEWNQLDDTVWYEIFSFSRPATWLSMVAYPYVRFKQELFARQSTYAMVKAIQQQTS